MGLLYLLRFLDPKTEPGTKLFQKTLWGPRRTGFSLAFLGDIPKRKLQVDLGAV